MRTGLRDDNKAKIVKLLLVVNSVWMNLLLIFPFIDCSLTVYCADGLRSSNLYEVASGPSSTSCKKEKFNN